MNYFFLAIAGLLGSVLLVPTLVVEWVDSENRAFSMTAVVEKEFAGQCVENGFIFEQRFLAEWCQKRNWWLDDCEETKRHIRQLDFDVLTQNYSVRSDFLGDEKQPVRVTFEDFDQALQAVRAVDAFPLQFLYRGKIDLKRDPYVSVRTFNRCEGAYSTTRRHLSTLLTLGLFSLEGSDSGWNDFAIGSQLRTRIGKEE